MSDVDPASLDRTAASALLLDSFRHWLQRDLVAPDGTPLERAERLFRAPFVVVAHGTEPDPVLFYGNRTALDLWGLDEATLRRTPSRLTAEPVHRDERARLLERTRREGFVNDYRGIRVTSTGGRFLVERAIVWNLLDARGRHAGQAATFDRWTFLDAQPTGTS